MKAFHCDRCGSLVFFENTQCVKCGATLGFVPGQGRISALEPAGEALWRLVNGTQDTTLYRQCQNQREYQVCNWLVEHGEDAVLCQSCRLNDTIPDCSSARNRELWGRLEQAKRRLLYTLRHLQLPVVPKPETGKPALRFKFLADPPAGPRIMTGHNAGVITLNIAEADDVWREQQRVHLHEPFRTLLGHFRHEIAHYYWDQLIAAGPNLGRFLTVFGDESRDYAAALQEYYKVGAKPDWVVHYVSAYASSHPWEDWAETWAHYLHIRDTVETAASFGLKLRPNHPDAAAMTADPPRVPEDERSFDRILRHWLPVTYALNELNRGMGLPDVYPFVLSEDSMNKLRFVHEVVLSSH